MKKSDVQFHREMSRPGHPAINVKYYGDVGIVDRIKEAFQCSEQAAERAWEYAYESQQGQFWEMATEEIPRILGRGQVYGEGRSGGWLVVHGLPDVDSWDAVMLGKWASVCKYVRELIADLGSWESIRDLIAANRWAESGAEVYNFVDTPAGSACLVDLKASRVATLADALRAEE